MLVNGKNENIAAVSGRGDVLLHENRAIEIGKADYLSLGTNI
jgi:hypothetical protein